MCLRTPPVTPEIVSPFLRLTAVSVWVTQLNTSVFRLPCSLLSSFPILWQRTQGRRPGLCDLRGLEGKQALWSWVCWPGTTTGQSALSLCWWLLQIYILSFPAQPGACCLSFPLVSQDWRFLWNSGVSITLPLIWTFPSLMPSPDLGGLHGWSVGSQVSISPALKTRET